jgi:BirA family biotin operon repressor/biotin-[acetyl-CoA-carboxylase] ligase
MKELKVHNPFNAPVYHKETVSSTMDVSRQLAAEGAPHGTIIAADFQETGRGRGENRLWEMERGFNLPFTIFLRYPRIEDIPAALTLRTGLAVSLAIEDFAPSLHGNVFVKWPNDIMIAAHDGVKNGVKKAAGILCESNVSAQTCANVHIGIGLNVAQKKFPLHLQGKATSITLAVEQGTENNEKRTENTPPKTPLDRFDLLEKILVRLHNELESKIKESEAKMNWKFRLEQRLYKKDEAVVFIDGAADSGRVVKGRLAGIGDSGEILIIPEGNAKTLSFVAGELRLYETF